MLRVFLGIFLVQPTHLWAVFGLVLSIAGHPPPSILIHRRGPPPPLSVSLLLNTSLMFNQYYTNTLAILHNLALSPFHHFTIRPARNTSTSTPTEGGTSTSSNVSPFHQYSTNFPLIGEQVSRWPGYQVSRWAFEHLSIWAFEQMSRWAVGQLSRWPGEQVTRWQSDQVTRWADEQMSRWAVDQGRN